jgi:hypothetical protein
MDGLEHQSFWRLLDGSLSTIIATGDTKEKANHARKC